MRRPNALWWLYYQYSGRLPERYRDWVLHDATCRTWLLRVFVRGLVMVAPIAVALFFVVLWLVDSVPIAIGAIVLGLLVNLRFSLAYSEESTDSRVARNGFPYGKAKATRAARYEAEHAAEEARYRATYRPDET